MIGMDIFRAACDVNATAAEAEWCFPTGTIWLALLFAFAMYAAVYFMLSLLEKKKREVKNGKTYR